ARTERRYSAVVVGYVLGIAARRLRPRLALGPFRELRLRRGLERAVATVPALLSKLLRLVAAPARFLEQLVLVLHADGVPAWRTRQSLRCARARPAHPRRPDHRRVGRTCICGRRRDRR